MRAPRPMLTFAVAITLAVGSGAVASALAFVFLGYLVVVGLVAIFRWWGEPAPEGIEQFGG